MDKTYNNTRGIEQFKNKLTSLLHKHNFSNEDTESFVSEAVGLFGDNIGVMPVDGMVSATALINALEVAFGDNNEASWKEILKNFSINSVSTKPINTRLAIDDVRTDGESSSAALSDSAKTLHNEIEIFDDSTEVVAYNPDGSFAKRFVVSSLDMIDYMEDEDLTDEGKRSRGFLPSDFDSTNMLSTPSESEGRRRVIGDYGHDERGEIYIKCPACASKDVIPVGAGTYMCMTCEPSNIFDVDLLLDDLNPELN